MTTISAANLAIAAQFVAARRAAEGFSEYPGILPRSLNDAYAIQRAAADGWGQPISGWKVGRIMGEFAERHGEDRFIGPIFAESIVAVPQGEPGEFPVLANGFAALEAELVAVLGQDVPPVRTARTGEEAAALVGEWRIGIEMAGSPLASIGDLGPLASISAFGNNLGLLLGTALGDVRRLDEVECAVSIDGRLVRSGRAGELPGGPLAGLAFALNRAALMAITIPSGTVVSTGAITGVHPLVAGQHCSADFGRCGRIDCRTVTARPVQTGRP